MHWKRGRYRRAPLRASAGLNGICNRHQPPPTALATSSNRLTSEVVPSNDPCPPALPPASGFVQSFKDWRNNLRIRLFNEHMERLADHFHVPFIDEFQITWPMLQASHDAAHFIGYPQSAIVDVLLHTLCPPPAEG